ncbi:MAG TPA: hypothetical protein VHT68_01340 [Pseudolabrys sp.]|jgi:hypothetical protein|nr:hypothetical protein [Pseudolabrys sp.]
MRRNQALWQFGPVTVAEHRCSGPLSTIEKPDAVISALAEWLNA